MIPAQLAFAFTASTLTTNTKEPVSVNVFLAISLRNLPEIVFLAITLVPPVLLSTAATLVVPLTLQESSISTSMGSVSKNAKATTIQV